MSHRTRTLTIGFALFLGLVFATAPVRTAQAQDDVTRDRRDVSLMMRKLSRGLINIVTGWVEVPKNIALRWKQTDPFSGFVWGGISGIGWAFARTVGGVYEVVTFPFPYPKDYAPLIEPEFILTPLWGESPPFMTSEPVNPSKSFE